MGTEIPDNTLSIIHTITLGSEVVGGIETWIRDFASYSGLALRILGAARSGERNKHEGQENFEQICRLPSRRRFVPDVLRLAFGLVLNRRKLSNFLLVHRIELIPILRFLKPKAHLVLIVHSNQFKQLDRGSDSIWRFFRALYFSFERVSLRGVNRVISHSSADFSRLSAHRPDAIFLPGWYNDSVFFQKRDRTSRWTFIWVGRFEVVKDPLLAIQAFAHVAAEREVSLLMVGAGSLREAMARRVSELHLTSKVSIADPVSHSELARLYNSADIMLITSHFEGSSRALLEAMACGLRVVSVREADPDGWIGDQSIGSYPSSRDSIDIAATMLQALDSPNRGSLSAISDRAAIKVVPIIEKLMVAN